MKLAKTSVAVAATLGSLLFSAQSLAIAISVDIINVVDESGSMGGEHAWIDDAMTALQNELVATAAGDALSANYGLVGYGGSSSHGIGGHQHDVGGGQFGTAAQFATATGTLVTSGGTEDGYEAMGVALGYNFNANHATNIILITDEDRDVFDGSYTYASILADLQAQNALLNAVVSCSFEDAQGNSAIGIDSDGNAYVADGSGGFTKSAGGTQSGSCAGTTNADYVDLALDTGGAAWNLNILRSGGLLADSFTNAFVDIKVSEIVGQQPPDPNPNPNPNPIPNPMTLSLLGIGLAAMGVSRRRNKV